METTIFLLLYIMSRFSASNNLSSSLSDVSSSISNKFFNTLWKTVTMISHPVTLSCNYNSMFGFLIKRVTNIFLLHVSQVTFFSPGNGETLRLQLALIH